MGAVYYNQELYNKALESHAKALSIRLATFGENSPITADTMVNMALANARLGHCAQAKVKVTKAVSIYKATLGDNHAKTKKWTNFLASVKL